MSDDRVCLWVRHLFSGFLKGILKINKLWQSDIQDESGLFHSLYSHLFYTPSQNGLVKFLGGYLFRLIVFVYFIAFQESGCLG